ncbi:MAG: phosphatidylserine decarboxylase [Candidatus Kariarchaeaceae archaeon]
MFAKGSFRFIFPAIAFGVILFFFCFLCGLIFIGFGIYLAWFFRDPRRDIVVDHNKIYAAADGKIIYIKRDAESLKYAIRMSPFDVHINRAPIHGKVTGLIHQPGKHASVYFSRVDEKNERNLIILENEFATCEVLQITGIFARRIDCWVNKEDEVEQCQKIGIIRFGSQTNIQIKLKRSGKSIKSVVSVGDKVKAGISVLGEIP